jgi:hypothetical protein
MDRNLMTPDAASVRLRRVGRVARRRMRIDGAELANGLHPDGTLTVEISGLGSPVAGMPDSFEWTADRPIALVIVRSGIDGEAVDFGVGPSRQGISRGVGAGDGTGIRYVAFCYDAPVAATPAPVAGERVAAATPVAVPLASPARRRLAAASAFAPTGRDRRSILGLLLQGPQIRRATT